MNRWPAIAGVAALMAGGAAIRALFLRYPYIDSDQAVIGLMGMHILKGEFPIYFWGEPYSGTLESFVAAVFFFLFGVSRLTLNLVPFFFSLIFLLLTWRLGIALFDRTIALLGLAFVAFPPMLLTWHSVLARGNYIENLVFGNVLFLLALKLARPGLGPATHSRALGLYGLVSGFAWYMSFQSLHYLIASALFLLWRGRRGLILRQGWIGLSAALLGSLPFWIYNLTTGFSSLGAMKWYAKGASLMDALWLFFAVKLPVLLGASGFAYNFERLVTRQLPSLEWMILGLCGASFLLALGWSVRGWIAHRAGGPGIELLFLLPLVVGVVTVWGGFGAGSDARYLLPIYTSLPLFLAALVGGLARFSRPVGALALGVVLFSNLYGNLTTAEGLPRYETHLDNDRALFAYMREHGISHAFVPEYWFSYRFTFDAEESIIFATPFWRDSPRYLSKYPLYTRLVSRAPSAYVLWGVADEMERTLRAAGEQFEKVVIGRFTLLHHFQVPQPEGRSLSTSAWRLVGGTGREAFDRDPTTQWRGAVTDPLVVDLGETSSLLRISIYLGEESLGAPHGLQTLASVDGREWRLLISTGPLIPGFAGVGDRLFLEEHGRVGLAFPPVAARYLKIQPAPGSRAGPWGVNELFAYAEGNEASPSPFLPEIRKVFFETLGAGPQEMETRALLDSLRLIRVAPDLEAAHILFRMALLNLGLPLNWVAIEEHLATRLAQEGRWAETIPFYRSLTQRQPFRSLYWRKLKAAYEKLGAVREAKAVEAEALSRFMPTGSSQVQFGRTFRLLGHQMEPMTVSQGGLLHLTLIWQALRTPGEEYAIFVHVTDGRRRAFGQDHYPLKGVFPTSRWERGEVVREEDQIPIPPELAPGRYHVNVGVWQPKSRAHLRIWQGWLPTWKKSYPLGEITVVPATSEDGHDPRL